MGFSEFKKRRSVYRPKVQPAIFVAKFYAHAKSLDFLALNGSIVYCLKIINMTFFFKLSRISDTFYV